MFFRIFSQLLYLKQIYPLSLWLCIILFMFILIVIVSWILELLNVFLLGILPLKKGTSAFILQMRHFFVSTDVTFFENESYFSSLYLQGEISSMEDKSVFLLDLSLSSSSYSSLCGETPKIVNVPMELELESPEPKFHRVNESRLFRTCNYKAIVGILKEERYHN